MTATQQKITLDRPAPGFDKGWLRSRIVAFHQARLRSRELRKLREMPRERLADMGIDPFQARAPLQGHDTGPLPAVLMPGRMW